MDDQSQNDELYPIAVLIDELKVRLLPPMARSTNSVLCILRAYSRAGTDAP